MSENSESLLVKLVDLLQSTFEDEGLTAGEHWEETRLFFSFEENGTMRWWAWYRLGRKLGALGPRHPYGDLGFSLRSALIAELGEPVGRFRIDVTPEWETLVATLPTPSADGVRDRWVWSDETDNAGDDTTLADFFAQDVFSQHQHKEGHHKDDCDRIS